MIKIEITDPQLLDNKTLIATAKYLMNLAGCELMSAPLNVNKTPEFVSNAEIDVNKPRPAETLNVNNMGALPIEVAAEDHRLASELSSTEFVNPLAGLDINKIPPGVHTVNSLDSAGQPWNPELHSRTKSKTNDGKWRIKQRMNVANQPAIVPSPPAKQTLEIVSQTDVIEEETPLIPQPPTRQGDLPRHEPRENGTKWYLPEHDVTIAKNELEDWRKPYEVSLDTLMTKITPLLTKKILKNQDVFDIIQSFGVGSMFELVDHPDLLPKVDDALNELIEKRKNEPTK